MSKRLVALVVTLACVGGTIALVTLTGSSSSSNNLRKLPAAAAGGTSSNAEGSTPAVGAAPAVGGDMALAPDRSSVEYVVKDGLPALGGHATAYELSGGGGVDDIQALAAALGITGTEQTKGEYSIVAGSTGQVTLQHSGMRSWSMFRVVTGSGCSAASDGTTSCSGGGVATPAIACAPPPCEANRSCPEPANCAPEPPVHPADLPSKTDAEKIARALLGTVKVDVGSAKVNVADGFSTWLVQFTPVIDAQAVGNLVTTVAVGPKGVIQSANGFFATPVRLGDYPLAGTARGIERLKAGKYLFGGGIVPLVGVATAAGAMATAPATAPPSGAGSVPSPAPTRPVGTPVPVPPPTRTLTITGARLQLSLVQEASGGGLLVPSYVFTVNGGSDMPAVPAVVDSLLSEPVGGTPSSTPVSVGTGEPTPAPAAKPMPSVATP
jgi:hypothetical protein